MTEDPAFLWRNGAIVPWSGGRAVEWTFSCPTANALTAPVRASSKEALAF